jgi:hypothetical protein
MRLATAALIVLAASWLPLIVVGLADPAANPIGLGLLALAGTVVAAGLLAVAALLGLWRLLR